MARIFKLIKTHMIIFTVVCLLSIRKSLKPVKILKIERFVPDMKYILVWTNIHGIEEEGQKYFIDKDCKYMNCYITNNDSLFGDVRYFDAILFNAQDVSRDIISLPPLRSSMQKYVFVANVSSDNFPVCNEIYDNFFNWTWTYRYDSTMSYQFITIFNLQYMELGNRFLWEPHMNPIDNTLKSQFITKSKAAVIFLDKCRSRSKREDVIENLRDQLSKYNLTIDVFGKCGDKKCRRKNMKPCFWRLKKTYYFYLAFEDSMSLDYVTDIVLNAYDNNAVPIVYGGAEYSRYLPPGSYLNVHNTTLGSLAYTMYKIISNKETYYDFFRWKNHYTLTKSPILNGCVLCETLNNPYRLTSTVVYSQFRKWWNAFHEKRCNEKYNTI